MNLIKKKVDYHIIGQAAVKILFCVCLSDVVINASNSNTLKEKKARVWFPGARSFKRWFHVPFKLVFQNVLSYFPRSEFAVITVENWPRLHVTFVSHVAYITRKLRLFQNKVWAQLNTKLPHICVTPINSYSKQPFHGPFDNGTRFCAFTPLWTQRHQFYFLSGLLLIFFFFFAWLRSPFKVGQRREDRGE